MPIETLEYKIEIEGVPDISTRDERLWELKPSAFVAPIALRASLGRPWIEINYSTEHRSRLSLREVDALIKLLREARAYISSNV